MLESLPAFGPSFLLRSSYPSGISGKLYVPVSPENTVYAQFRHVVGVSASEPGAGIPLLKLRILDNLIENYLNARHDPSFGRGGEKVKITVSARNVDATINALSADLHEAIAARPQPFGGAHPDTGTVLSLGA